MKMLVASGCEYLIEVGFDMEDTYWVWTVRIQREDGAEYGVTCRLRVIPIWFKKWRIIIEEEGNFLEKCCSEELENISYNSCKWQKM